MDFLLCAIAVLLLTTLLLWSGTFSANVTPSVFTPQLKSWVWLKWYNFMASKYPQRYWTMMNYGFAPLQERGSKGGTAEIELHESEEWERYSIQMYHHVAAGTGLARDCDRTGLVAGREVLEVGCGRGGGLAWLARGGGQLGDDAQRPKRAVGLDFSPVQIEFCRRSHGDAGADGSLSYVEGDALALPFSAGSFDTVLSIESSHCYPDFDKFVSEVLRVLRPGGRFLFADFRDAGEECALLERGLRAPCPAWCIEHTADITPHVIAALDLDHDRKVNDCLGLVPVMLRGFVEMFIGTKGSKTYRNFQQRQWLYHYYVLRKAS